MELHGNMSLITEHTDLHNIQAVDPRIFQHINHIESSQGKRKRSRYSTDEERRKLDNALIALLAPNSGKPNVRSVAEEFGIAYNTLRDHFKAISKARATATNATSSVNTSETPGSPYLIMEPRLTSDGNVSHIQLERLRPVGCFKSHRGRRTALPKFVEQFLRIFVSEMSRIGLDVDRTQFKQVALKVAYDLGIFDFKATDMWVHTFRSRHQITLSTGDTNHRIKNHGLFDRHQWRLCSEDVLEGHCVSYKSVSHVDPNPMHLLGPKSPYAKTNSALSSDEASSSVADFLCEGQNSHSTQSALILPDEGGSVNCSYPAIRNDKCNVDLTQLTMNEQRSKCLVTFREICEFITSVTSIDVCGIVTTLQKFDTTEHSHDDNITATNSQDAKGKRRKKKNKPDITQVTNLPAPIRPELPAQVTQDFSNINPSVNSHGVSNMGFLLQNQVADYNHLMIGVGYPLHTVISQHQQISVPMLHFQYQQQYQQHQQQLRQQQVQQQQYQHQHITMDACGLPEHRHFVSDCVRQTNDFDDSAMDAIFEEQLKSSSAII